MCDIRVYCPKCAQDVRDAGYVLKRTDNVYKSECDKCMRQGFTYRQKKGNKNGIQKSPSGVEAP